MAFSYRNPLEIAINKLPGKQSDQLLSLTSDLIEKEMETVNSLFSFFVEPPVQELLSKAGIQLAPVAFKTHSHPACKMIENHILFNVLPSLLSSFNSVAFFSLRSSKVNRFLKMHSVFSRGKIKNFGHYNALIDSKDRCRYGYTTFESFKDRVAGLRDECVKLNRFPKVLLMHDELHFLSPEEIAYLFEQIPEISQVVCTLVCPPELLFGDRKSREPRIYGIETSKFNDQFFFLPDNYSSEAYRQSIKTSTWPLKKRSIRWFDRSIKVSKVYSLFAHHVIIFERGRSSETTLLFNKPSCLLDYELEIISKNFAGCQIERSTMASICTYLSCLKSPNAPSAVAKLRQLEKRDLFPDELSFVYSLSSKFSEFGLSDELNSGLWRKIKDGCIQALPKGIADFFFEERNFNLNIRSLLGEVSKKTLLFEREIYRLEEHSRVEFGSMSDLVWDICDQLGVQIIPINRLDRQSRPYYTVTDELGSAIHESEDIWWFPVDFKVYVGSVQFVIDAENARSFRLIRDFLKCIARGADWRRVRSICGKEKGIESNESSGEIVAISVSGNQMDSSAKEEHVDFDSDRQGFEGSLPVDLIQAFQREVEDVKLSVKGRRNACVFVAIAKGLGLRPDDVISTVFNSDISDELMEHIEEDRGLSHELIEEILIIFECKMVCTSNFFDFYYLNRKFGTKHVIYCTIKGNHCELSSKELFTRMASREEEASTSGSDFCGSMDHLFDIKRTIFSSSSAAKLAKSMNRGTTGTLKEIQGSYVKELSEIAGKIVGIDSSFEIGMRLGFAGSGKSKRVIDFILMTPTVKRLFISPRRALADEVICKLKGTSCEVMTFEVALTKANMRFKDIILDEISLYPPGYVSLLQIALHKSMIKGVSESGIRKSWEMLSKQLPKIYCIGDPLQTRYHSDLDTVLLEKKSEIDIFIQGGGYRYLWQGFRFGKWFRNLVDIPTREDDEEFSIKIHPDLSTVKRDSVEAILVPSQEDKNFSTNGLPVYTYGESQGLTKGGRVLIMLNHNSFKVSVNAALVAMTRSKVGFDFLLNGISGKDVMRLSEKHIWSFPLKKIRIPMERFQNLLPGAQLVQEDFVGNESFQNKLSNDIFIMPFVNLAEEEKDPEEVKGEIVEAPEWFKCHLPIFNANPLIIEIFEKMHAKEQREFQSILGYSNQFLDLEKKGAKTENYPMAFQNVFPHHQASDDVTFWEGVKKRIRKSNWRTEKSKLDEVMEDGPKLLEVFLKMLPNKFEVNIEDIDKGEQSFIEKRKEKSGKLWEAHSERSDIDWSLDRVFLFMKSQFCTKEGKMFTEAKAGQTLACFQHIVLFRFGPMLRAIERAFIRACGESYYIHSGKNFFCLDSFVTQNSHLFQGESIESDYTAFDSSQDHVILSFEIALLKHLNLNDRFIMDYTRLKLSLGCRLGSLAVMRFTGEFCTFLFNTFANMLFTGLKYEVDHRKHRILFAGDDMCSLSGLKRSTNKEKASLLQKFSLVAVEEVKKYPMFCGWYLTPEGILKSPRLLWARIQMMQQRNLLHTCIDNYLFEAIFAYRLGEKLYEVLKESDFEYHYLVVRFFVKKSNLLKGSSVQLIKEIGEGIGCKWHSSMSTRFLQRSNHLTLKLTQSNHLNYIRMQPFCDRQFLIVSKDLKPTSKSLQRQEKTYTCRTLNFLTSQKLILSPNPQTNINTCMSGSSSSQLEQCFQISRGNMAESLFMTVHALMRTGLKRSLLLKDSHLEKIHAILPYAQNTSSLPQTLISRTSCDSSSISIVRNMQLIENLLLLTLELHTGCAMHLDFWTQKIPLVIGPNNLSLDVLPWNTMKTLDQSCINLEYQCLLKKRVQIFMSKRDSWLGLRCAVHVLCLPKEQQIRGLLGRSRFVMIEIITMSLWDAIVLNTRGPVLRYLWNHHIDRERKIIPKERDLSKLEGEEKAAFESVSTHCAEYIFGNIAVFGSSVKTQYPNLSFTIPTITVKIGEQSHSIAPKIVLAMLVPNLEHYRMNSGLAALESRTFRNLCEAFAKEAYSFLKDNWSKGILTNIYRKWPRAFESAPWVAFDFAAGLDMTKLSPDERKVLDRLTKRLFHTEGQKGVFEAQADSNLDLEG